MKDDRSTTTVLNGQHADEVHATPTEQVAPLSYTQLRMLAECAVGVNNHPAEFFFPGGGALERAAPTATLGAADVVVPALDYGKYPGNRVQMEVSTREHPARMDGPPVGVADALFWSDAAVQKFVFPYVASCGGDDATELLGKLQSAWNHYPAERVTVYGLVHVNSFQPDTPLNLGRALWIAYADSTAPREDPPLQMLPLIDFVREFPPVRNPVLGSPEPVHYHRGRGSRHAQHPDYAELRALAEYACSIRGAPVYFVFRADRRGFDGPYGELPSVRAGDIVVPVQTPTVPADRPYLGGVWFQAEQSVRMKNLADHGDALFWSTGAIEQFLFPYYASKGGFEALDDLKDMVHIWTGHWPHEEPHHRHHYHLDEAVAATVEDDDEPGRDEVVAALIHLQTSEYTWVTEGGGVGGEDDAQQPVTRLDPWRQVALVTVDGAGETHVRRAHRFIASRRNPAR